MAYTALNLGYTPQAGYEYAGTTDSSLDWGLYQTIQIFMIKL